MFITVLLDVRGMRVSGASMMSRDRADTGSTDDDGDIFSVDSSASGGRAYTNGRPEAWWSYGSRGGPPSALVPTHPSARYSLTGPAAFGVGGGSVGRRSSASGSGADDEVVWDLSESLAELYERDQRREAALSARPSPDGASGEATTFKVDVASWLVADPGNGFMRVFAPGGVGVRASRLVPCTLTTTAHKICLQLGVPGTSLHIQLAGDAVRRLEPHDQPLTIQNDYLTKLGYSNVAAMQAEGISDDLPYLVKFYSGTYMYRHCSVYVTRNFLCIQSKSLFIAVIEKNRKMRPPPYRQYRIINLPCGMLSLL